MKTHVATEFGPCVNFRRGCRGRLTIEVVAHRGPDGVLTRRPALVCSKCGQAHGPVR